MWLIESTVKFAGTYPNLKTDAAKALVGFQKVHILNWNRLNLDCYSSSTLLCHVVDLLFTSGLGCLLLLVVERSVGSV